jgi:hypothetical protein
MVSGDGLTAKCEVSETRESFGFELVRETRRKEQPVDIVLARDLGKPVQTVILRRDADTTTVK